MAYNIEIDDVTTGSLDGTGYFDKLMQTVALHVAREFDNNRLNSSNYAEVYLSAMQNALSQAFAFALAHDKAANDAQISENQASLLECEAAKCRAEIARINEETNLVTSRIANTDAQTDIYRKDLLIKDQEILQSKAKVIHMGYENDLIVKQLVKIDKDIQKETAEILGITANTAATDKNTLLTGVKIQDATLRLATIQYERNAIIANTGLTNAKTASENVRTQLLYKELLKAAIQITLLEDEHLLNGKKIIQFDIENQIATAKLANEAKRLDLLTAQVKAEEIKYLGGAAPNSIMAAQQRLVNNQAASYKAKIQETKAKLYSDMFSVSRTQVDLAGVVKTSDALPIVDELDNVTGFI